MQDFNATSPAIYSVDTSALAIFASGVIEIANYTTDGTAKARYLAAARSALDALTGPIYLNSPAKSDAMVNNGTVAYPSGVGIALPYAGMLNFFFESSRPFFFYIHVLSTVSYNSPSFFFLSRLLSF